MDKQQGAWIRFAVRGKAIKDGSPYGWRSFIEKNPEIPLRDVKIKGPSTHRNPVFKFLSTPDKYDVLAWVAYFGTYTIKDDIMFIELEEPTSLSPWGTQQ